MPNPVTYWSKALRVGDVAKYPYYRPPRKTGLVYVAASGPDPDKDILHLGSGHATENTDGRARVGNLIGAMLDFGVWHSGGITLAGKFSLDQISDFYVLWACISGCPILAERDLLAWHQSTGQLLKVHKPRTTSYCKKVCIHQPLVWSSIACP